MTDILVLATDGSELSMHALRAGLRLVHPGLQPVLVMVIDHLDPMLVTGTGFAGGTMSPEAYEEADRAQETGTSDTLVELATALGLSPAQTRVLHGHPGTAICEFAEEVGAVAIVIGSRGHGGFKRAVIGSVSDHVVRHAPCPVIVMSHAAQHDGDD